MVINEFRIGLTRTTDVEIEIVEVPFVDGSMPGYFVHAQNSTAKQKPTVVFFDGLDVTKELLYMRGVPDLIKRGISVLIMDGPGTGEAIRFRKHYLRHDYEVAGSACVDWLEKRADVNPKKIGIVANSLGGYYAPRCASMEPRFAACVAWGAIWIITAHGSAALTPRSMPRCRCPAITSPGYWV